MAHHTKQSVLAQVESELTTIESSKGLPFRDLLSSERILAAIQHSGLEFRERVFTPMVTLWAI